MTIGIGTIGSLKPEISLNNILMDLKDAKVTNYVMNRLYKFRAGLEQFSYMKDNTFITYMLDKWLEDFRKQIVSKNLPSSVESHVCCCLTAYYRNAKKQLGLKH